MSYGAICKHCRCWTQSHDAQGKCHMKLNREGDECPCDRYELEPGTDIDLFPEAPSKSVARRWQAQGK
jgi:hypothetical protein